VVNKNENPKFFYVGCHNHHYIGRRFVDKCISVNTHQLSGLLVCAGIAAILSGCSAHRRLNQATPLVEVGRGYVDLMAGWRVRVVTPIDRSGTFQLQTAHTEFNGHTVTVDSGNDFLGYELAYYAVTTRPSDGVAVSFLRAEKIIGGVTRKEASAQVRLFDLPENYGYVRLVFLTRLSQADHNEAIIAASSFADLEDLTEKLQANPEMNCERESQGICSWVPAGISVQPERREPQRSYKWVPAT
jgi:hypothetical protein